MIIQRTQYVDEGTSLFVDAKLYASSDLVEHCITIRYKDDTIFFGKLDDLKNFILIARRK